MAQDNTHLQYIQNNHMLTCTHTDIFLHLPTYKKLHTCTRTHTHTYKNKHAYASAHTNVCTHTDMHTHAHIHTLLSMSSLRFTADWMVHNSASTRPAQLLMNTRAGSPADDTLRNVPAQKHMHKHAHTNTCTHADIRTYTCRNILTQIIQHILQHCIAVTSGVS